MSIQNTNINFTCYVAIGDSITSGYTDGALYYEGQLNSYANIMAGQFKLVGGGGFKQPLMDPNSVGANSLGKSRLVLKNISSDLGADLLALSYFSEQGDITSLSKNIYNLQGPFNNMSVPGAKTTTTLAVGFGNPNNGEGNYNLFFTHMASRVATASILSDALALNPTFFSLFIGSNDVLAFALSGGTLDFITPSSGEPGIGFEGSLRSIVNALTLNGAKGVIANIPNISSVPYFTTIPYNGLLLDQSDIHSLNERYNSPSICFYEGRNNFVISDPLANTHGIRQIEKGEFILLDILLDKDKLSYLRAIAPIPKKYVLTMTEILKIQKTINDYNTIIKSIALEKKLAFVDINSHVKTTAPDRSYNDKTLHLNYKKKGVFSLDGLHPNPFGQALLANEFIKAINITYGSAIPTVRSRKYKGITFPKL